MTTPTPPAGGPPAAGSPSPQTGIPVRSLTAWALLALAAVLVFFNLLQWIFPDRPRDFLDRLSVEQFANMYMLVAPLLALLVAAKLGPAVRGARIIGLGALATYAAALLFGAFAFLLTIANKFTGFEFLDGFHTFGATLQGLGDIIYELLLLVLLGLAALWTFTIFTALGGKLPAVTVGDS